MVKKQTVSVSKKQSNQSEPSKQPRLSLCMIVKDEERFLPACLESVRGLVDELIIVDTGSSDKTKEIAQRFINKVGGKLLDFVWINDFSAARNESLKHATGDWILVLDADEVIAHRDHETIQNAISQAVKDKTTTAFSVQHRDYGKTPLRSAFAGEEWRTIARDDPYKEQAKDFAGYKPDAHIRLFKNHQGYGYEYCVHEDIYLSIMRNKGVLKDVPKDAPFVIHHYGFGEQRGDKQGFQKTETYLKLLKKQVRTTPTHPQPVFTLASYYFDHGVDELQGFDKASLEQKKNDLKATILLERLAKLYPKFEKLYPYLGKLYMRNNRAKDAERVYLYSIKVAPQFKDSYLHLASLYFNQGQKELALKVMLKATENKILDVEVYLTLGFLLLKNDRPADAVKILEHSLKLFDGKVAEDVIQQITMNLSEARSIAQSLASTKR